MTMARKKKTYFSQIIFPKALTIKESLFSEYLNIMHNWDLNEVLEKCKDEDEEKSKVQVWNLICSFPKCKKKVITLFSQLIPYRQGMIHAWHFAEFDDECHFEWWMRGIYVQYLWIGKCTLKGHYIRKHTSTHHLPSQKRLGATASNSRLPIETIYWHWPVRASPI